MLYLDTGKWRYHGTGCYENVLGRNNSSIISIGYSDLITSTNLAMSLHM